MIKKQTIFNVFISILCIAITLSGIFSGLMWFHGNTAYAINSPISQELNSEKSNRDDKCVRNIGRSIINIHVGELPTRVAYDSVNNRVYVANTVENTVSVINACTLKVIGTISVGDHPLDIVYDPVNDRVYVANNVENTVSVIDASTLEVIDTISVDGNPTAGIAYDSVNNRVYVTTVSNDKLNVIDASTLEVIDTVRVGTNPVYTAYDSVNNRVYVANFNGHSISVIDASTLEVIDTIPVDDLLTNGIVYDSVNNRVYMTNSHTLENPEENVPGTVSVIDASTLKIIDTISTVQPFGITYDSVNNRVYVTNNLLGENVPGTVSVIDASTLKIIDTISVGYNPTDITYDPVNNRLYVANAGSNSVSAISAATISIQKPPQQAIQNLIDTIDSMHLSKGTTTSLEAPLNAAMRQLDRNNNDVAACNSLDAFLHQVDIKENNGQLTPNQASDLRQQTTAIQDELGCSSSFSDTPSTLSLSP